MTSFGDWERVRELARDLPHEAPRQERVEAVRAALLARAAEIGGRPERVRSRRILLAVAAAAAFVAVGALAVLASHGSWHREGAAPGALRAEIRPLTESRYSRLGAQPDEIVRLREGTVTFRVEKLRAGERFRVVVGDAVVEVRGTVFDVTAADDRLHNVHVHEGKVEVRPEHGAVAVLLPGENWSAPGDAGRVEIAAAQTPSPGAGVAPAPPSSRGAGIDSARLAPRPVVAVAPRRVRSTPVAPSAVRPHETAAAVGSGAAPEPPSANAPAAAAPPSASEIAFAAGWRSLRAGDPRAAAAAFDRALAVDPAHPLAEDAAFWKAVSCARAGLDAEAAAVLAAFLDRYPASARAGEVSALLGWRRLAAGDREGARRLFAAAAADPVERVRASAGRGLRAIDGPAGATP
jgi:TolA-binding protein